jgi:hypothetical protein
MDDHDLPHTSRRGRLSRFAGAWALVPVLLALTAPPAAAADLTIQARPLLGGHVKLGSWAAVSVTVRNDGPPVRGELRLEGQRQGVTVYTVEVDLPTTSEKRFVLYGQPALLRSELQAVLVTGGRSIASATVKVTTHDSTRPIVAIVAERPERLAGDVRAAGAGGPNPVDVISLRAADLPPRVEPWFALDQLIWQDVDASELSPDQVNALKSWVAAGGRLVVLGGTTGATSLGALPSEILPYRPNETVVASPGDVRALLGNVTLAGGTFPSMAGTLERGWALASSGSHVIAAEAPYGRGATTIIGLDPTQPEIAGSAAARALWRRTLSSSRPEVRPFTGLDDGSIAGALNQLPSVELPRVEQLFGLLAGYILLVGPLNYFVLRRLDRREWAWLTIPALVVVFAVGSYGLGRLLKGDDVIVNQLSIVRVGGGTSEGLAQTYIGVFSPTRQRFDIAVGGSPLVSSVVSNQDPAAVSQPLDVVGGDRTRVRGYQVGYGALRGFRAEAAVPAPLVESTLRFVGGRLTGEVRNRSTVPLEAAAIVFGNGVQVLGQIDPGEARSVDVAVSGEIVFGLSLPERLFGSDAFPEPGSGAPQAAERVRATRRELLRQVTATTKFDSRVLASGVGGDVPVLLAWQPQGILPVELAGQTSRNLGQTLYVASLAANLEGRTVLGASLIRSAVIATDAADAMEQGTGFAMSRGTLTVEYRPPAFRGRFDVSHLALGMVQDEMFGGAGVGGVKPLPVQPPQERPNDMPLPGDADPQGLPAVQLFDRVTNRWVEFPPFELGRTYVIDFPGRYVDTSGAFVVRFVMRGDKGYFRLLPELEGTVR